MHERQGISGRFVIWFAIPRRGMDEIRNNEYGRLKNEEWIIRRPSFNPHWPCRGGDSQARPRSGIRTAKSMPCTVPCARPLMCHCEERSDVAISRNRSRFRLGFPDIRHGTARLPRPLRGLAMTNPGAITVLAIARANRSCSAGPGCPLPCIHIIFRFYL